MMPQSARCGVNIQKRPSAACPILETANKEALLAVQPFVHHYGSKRLKAADKRHSGAHHQAISQAE